MARKKTRCVRIGDKQIGGGLDIAIQSMCNTKTEDVDSTVAQILSLEKEGCDIIRVAAPTMEAARAIAQIKKRIHIPIVADIHFDYRLAIASIEAGADKIRINPGNIGSSERIRAVVEAAKERNIPIRIGVNSGSIEKDILARYGQVCPRAIVESAINKVRLVEDAGYDNIVVSLKASSVPICVKSYELASEKLDYPLHLGITEAGGIRQGTVKSSVGLGILLYEGIGDTIRVSLTGDPIEEVICAKHILKSLDLRKSGIEIISCPTCGRTSIDLIALEEQVEELVKEYDDLNLRLAVMGCVVNGPGEARGADIGIAGGNGEGLIFRKGEIVKKIPEDQLLMALKEELDEYRRSV